MTTVNQIIERDIKATKGKLVFAYVSASALPIYVWACNRLINEDNLYLRILMGVIGLTCVFSIPVVMGHALSVIIDAFFKVIKLRKS